MTLKYSLLCIKGLLIYLLLLYFVARGTLNVTSDSSAYPKAELWIFFHYFFSLVAGRADGSFKYYFYSKSEWVILGAILNQDGSERGRRFLS